MVRLHCISPSICFIMSLLTGECTHSQSVDDTKWIREAATSEGRSGFQRTMAGWRNRMMGTLRCSAEVNASPVLG